MDFREMEWEGVDRMYLFQDREVTETRGKPKFHKMIDGNTM
jgi:hypothetical protein